MLDTTADTLPRLDANRPAGLDLGEQVYCPDYRGLSIANLPASVCRWLGVEPLESAAPPLVPGLQEHWGRRFRNVVVLLLDGFGLDVLQRARQESKSDPDLAVWQSLPESALLAPLTSVVPSTTATALTSLWSGALPAEHGVIGYEVFLKEYSLIANMLRHTPASYSEGESSLRLAGFNPLTFLPVPLLGPHLARQGVRPYAFLHRSIAFSSVSTLLHREAETAPILSLSDLFIDLDGLLESASREKRYIYIYWSALDDLSHRYGPGDPRVWRELAAFSRQLGRFLADRLVHGRDDTLFILTADHGHIPSPKDAALEVRNHPELLDCLAMLPSGEARLPYAFVRAGREAKFLEYVRRTWGERFRVVPAADFLATGLLGDRHIYARLPERLGDYVVIPNDRAYWYFGYKENTLLGRHGGLTRTEMLVPFLGMKI
jgi:hypothetical protein